MSRALPGRASSLLVLLTCISLEGADEGTPALIKVTPAVVTVVAYNPTRAMPGLGTGFLVQDGRVVTARHVVAGCDRAEVRTSAGVTVRVAGILAEDRPGDTVLLALVESPAGASVLPVRAELPEAGERVYTVSAPLGLEWTASEGMVSAIRPIPGVGVAIQHTVPVSPGSSGCPLINAAGEVIAIQTATITTSDRVVQAGQNLNFAVPGSRIAALEAGSLRTLAECRREVPGDWLAPITAGIDVAGLRPIVRDDFRAALAFFEESVRRTPEEPDGWFRLGLCHEKLGHNREAADAYRKAIALNPDAEVPRNNLGVTYLRQGLYSEAAETLREAVDRRPDYTEALNSLSGAYVKLCRFDDARDAALKALQSNPDHAEARLNLAIAYWNTGAGDKAREEREKLLRLDRRLAEQLSALFEAGPPAGVPAAALAGGVK